MRDARFFKEYGTLDYIDCEETDAMIAKEAARADDGYMYDIVYDEDNETYYYTIEG